MEEIVDFMIYETGSGGDLECKSGYLTPSKGLLNQVYFALFGGNVDQNKEWWGNAYLKDENKMRSLFEDKLKNVSMNSSGLIELQEAAKSDLQYLSKYADVTVSASIIGVDKLQLNIMLSEPDSQSQKIKFIWDGTKNELIENIII